MFTVVLYDKEMSTFLEEYMSFLKPFIDKGCFALCRWNPAGMTVNQAVPELYDVVGERKEWRAIVLTHSFCDASENPFDFFRGEESAEVVEQQPLIRLTHMLSLVPHRVSVKPESADARKEEYQFNCSVSCQTVNEDKDYYKYCTGNFELDCYRPIQIALVATRQIRDGKTYLPPRKHAGQPESLFWDRNDYPSNVRFIAYDLHTSTRTISARDIFEMVNAILVLAMNDMYTIKLEAYKLYRMSIEIDQNKFEKNLSDFHQHLLNVSNEINHYRVILNEQSLKKQAPGELPNLKEEYVIEFPAGSVKELTVPLDGYGLAKDCPMLDETKWYGDVRRSEEAFEVFRKQPLRCLKRSIGEFRELEKIKNKPVTGFFDEFQLEDAREEMEQLEREMFNVEIADSMDFKREEKLRQRQKKAVINYMGIRMPRRDMIFAGTIAILLFLAGYVPYFISSFGDPAAMAQILLIVLVSVVVFACAGLYAMYLKRKKLYSLILFYNDIMLGIINQAKINQERYQRYVEKAFNYRKYWFFMKCIVKNQNNGPDIDGMPDKVMVKRHMAAAEEALNLCGKMRQVYDITSAPFFEIQSKVRYNFTVDPDKTGYYVFPTAADGAKAELNFDGRQTDTPYEYIIRLKMEKEALYDA